jgi:phospholipase/carboxylesterase
VRTLHAVALACALACSAGCGGGGGGGGDEEAAGTKSASTTTAGSGEQCAPGAHDLTLGNGQAARMHVTPGRGARALIVALHGAGGTPAGAIEAFTGGWDEPGLLLIAPASKGQTWSILRSEQDLDLESVNLALAEAYERCTIDRRRIAVGGFSDGATYALTLGVSNGDLFPAVIAFSPGGIVAGEQRGIPRFFVSHGTHDSVLPIASAGDAVVRKLRQAGYPVTYRRCRGDHEVPIATSRAAVRWFLDQAP